MQEGRTAIEEVIVRKLGKEELTRDKMDWLAQFLHKNLDKFGDDLPAIQKCLEYVATEGRGGSIFVAEKGDQTAGATVILKTHMAGFVPENFLVYIAVNPSFRGKGVGKKILDKAKQDLSGAIALHVEPNNPAKRLYEREGFTNKYLEMRFNPDEN